MNPEELREDGERQAQNAAVDTPLKREVRGQTVPVNSRQNTEPPEDEAVAARTIAFAGMLCSLRSLILFVVGGRLFQLN